MQLTLMSFLSVDRYKARLLAARATDKFFVAGLKRGISVPEGKQENIACLNAIMRNFHRGVLVFLDEQDDPSTLSISVLHHGSSCSGEDCEFWWIVKIARWRHRIRDLD